MLQPLPAETVFEAKQRAKRETFTLFTILVLLYIFFADLMALAVFLFFRSETRHHASQGTAGLTPLLIWVGGLAAMIAVLHFFIARGRSLDSLLDQMEAIAPDPKDEYHSRFLNLVGEAEAATGLHGIQAVILPTPGCNAFSLQDGKGACAIGVTEGILSRLSRNELSAVVAHEAAHLVHEDSRLVTTACFLFAVFGQINRLMGQVMSRTSSRKGFPAVIVVLWAISGVGYLITRWVSMAISREREYFADSDGVQMCKDPLAMAEGLYKISNRYKGSFPDSMAAMFILNPAYSGLHEQEGLFPNLFSTHPPVNLRIKKLLAWARSDMSRLEAAIAKEEKEGMAPKKEDKISNDGKSSYMVSQDGQWTGPYTPLQMLAMGNLTPGSWVCPSGSQEVTKASEAAELLPLFEDRVKGARSPNACPRCKVSFVSDLYEGVQVEQCGFCQGNFIPAGALERIIVREEKTFTPEEIKKARQWSDAPKSSFAARDNFPEINCPACGQRMAKVIHSMLSQVMIDRCGSCGSVWCDGGELETIQILMEEARQFQKD